MSHGTATNHTCLLIHHWICAASITVFQKAQTLPHIHTFLYKEQDMSVSRYTGDTEIATFISLKFSLLVTFQEHTPEISFKTS
jgi:hypothetical protein